MSTISPELVAQSRALSLSYFTNPRSYGGLSHTRDHKKIIECIEPKNRRGIQHGEYKTVMQTGGGAAGLGVDRSITHYAQTQESLGIMRAMKLNKDSWPLKVTGMHPVCAFVAARAAVLAEMATPGAFTLSRVQEWSEHFGVRGRVAATLGAISLSAQAVLERMQEVPETEGELLDHADWLYRGYNNVGEVRGTSMANIYAIGLHPYIGQNRNQKDPNHADIIQGYHASLGANRTHLMSTSRGLDDQTHGLLDTSMMLREAATCSVIAQNKPDMTFLDIRPAETRYGFEIVERDFSQYLNAA